MTTRVASLIPRRVLGKTGLNISCLGLGCAQFGEVYGPLPYEQMFNLVKYSFDNGVNVLDTSPFYGLGKSEQTVGTILKQLDNQGLYKREDYILCTKIGRYDENEFDFSRKRTLESIETSLNRLNTDYLDVVNAHDIEHSDNIEQIWDETLPTLQELKKQGVVRNIGLSGMPPNVLDYTAKKFGYDNIDTIITYNCYVLFNTELEKYMPKFRKHNIGILHGGYTGLGLMTPRGTPEWHPAPQVFKRVCAQAVEYVGSLKEYGNNPFAILRLAFLFTINNQDISSLFVGCLSPEELERNLKILENPKLSDRDLEVIRQVQQEILFPIMNRIYVNKGSEHNVVEATLKYYVE